MKHYIVLAILTLGLLCSCNNTGQNQLEHQQRAQQQADSIFAVITKKWNFQTPPLSVALKAQVSDWKEWNDFQKELSLKPISSIGAFQKKALSLSNTAAVLTMNIPPDLNTAAVRSRITVLSTHLTAIEMYLTYNPVPEKRLYQSLPEVNLSLRALVGQMEEIMTKKAVPKEMGEQEMLQALDTIRRANPLP